MDKLEKLYQDVYNKVDKMNNQFLKLQSHTKELNRTFLDYCETYNYIKENNINKKHKYYFLDDELSQIENSILDLNLHFTDDKLYIIEYEYRYNDLNIYSMKNDTNIFDTIGFNETSYNTRLIYYTPFNQLHEKLFNNNDYTSYNSDELDYLINDITYELEEMEIGLIDYYRYIRSVRKADRMIDDMLKNQISRFERYYQEFQKNNSQI